MNSSDRHYANVSALRVAQKLLSKTLLLMFLVVRRDICILFRK